MKYIFLIIFTVYFISNQIVFANKPSAPKMSEDSARLFTSISRFKEVDSQIKTLEPTQTIIFIDIDETLIKDGKGSKIEATLIDPHALEYISSWKVKGFKIALLTARMPWQYDATIEDLRSIGLHDKIPFFMTHGVKKGEWLKNQSKIQNSDIQKLFQGITNIVHTDDQSFQLTSIGSTYDPEQCHLFHLEFCYGDETLPSSPKGYAQVDASHSFGPSTFFLIDENGEKNITLKRIIKNQDTGAQLDQFKEEILSDALYKAIAVAEPSFKINIPQFRINRNKKQNEEYEHEFNRLSNITEVIPIGTELSNAQKQQISAGFIVDVFLSNWKALAPNRLFNIKEDKIYRISSNATLRYQETGKIKDKSLYDFNSAICDLHTIKGEKCTTNAALPINTAGHTLYEHLTKQEILEQIQKLAKLKNIILRTVDDVHAHIGVKDIETLKSSLIERLNSLTDYYVDQTIHSTVS